MAKTSSFSDIGLNYIGGNFVAPSSPDGAVHREDPADLSADPVIVETSTAAVATAVEAAREAVIGWRRSPRDERAAALRRFGAAVTAHVEDLARAIQADVGKAYWDALTEARAVASKVELVIGPGSALTQAVRSEQVSGGYRYLPLGVVGVIGPFNFPAHLPNGQFLPAMIEGNTVVVKVSEAAPRTAQLLARCMDAAGLPPGVFNLVYGAADVGEALVANPEVDGLFFTGSPKVGRAIERSSLDLAPGRLVALELGGKNASLLLPDAALAPALRACAFAAYVSAGQRCTATSRVYVPRARLPEAAATLCTVASAIKLGHPGDSDVFAGPLALRGTRNTYLAAITKADAQLTRHTSGTAHPLAATGYFVPPAVYSARSCDTDVPGFTDVELFGPCVTLFPYDEVEEAIAAINRSRYGLAAAIFGGDEARFSDLAAELRCGLVHWNRSTAGASGALPFGGVGDSGNFRPAGIFAGLQCVFAQTWLGSAEPASDQGWPGFP